LRCNHYTTDSSRIAGFDRNIDCCCNLADIVGFGRNIVVLGYCTRFVGITIAIADHTDNHYYKQH
jgi:hypothetical protein